MRLAVVIGSTRPGRFGPVVASWVTTQARQHGDVDTDTIDVYDHQVVDHEAVASLRVRVAAADAFLFVVPEYNHSFPGELKTMIDRFKDEWAKKPVGFVSYGGLSGGLRAVEQLRLVFIELSAVPIRDTVSFHGARSAFDADGNPHEHGAARQALGELLAQLTWWAAALRVARRTQPPVLIPPPTTSTLGEPMSKQSTKIKKQPIGHWTGEAYRHISGAIRESLAAEGLTQPQWWMLNHVANGQWTPTALLDRLAPFNANEQGLNLDHELDGLIERGWLTRDTATQRLSLTTQGEKGRQQAWKRNGATHRDVIAGVSDQQYEDCITVLRRIVGNLGGDPSPY